MTRTLGSRPYYNLVISSWLERLSRVTNRRKRLLNFVMLLEDLTRLFAPQIIVVILFANYIDQIALS